MIGAGNPTLILAKNHVELIRFLDVAPPAMAKIPVMIQTLIQES